MADLHIPVRCAFVYSLVSFAIAALSLTGVILEGDFTGRLIWTAVWAFIGVAWLVGILRSGRREGPVA